MTSVATECQSPEQVLTTRQNRCLHGVSKCNGAGVSHFVAVETELRQGDVRLAIATLQLLDRVLLTYTACVRSPKKNTRVVTRFVQMTVFFERITDSVQ